jgi:hypothetical protein
MHSHFTMTFPSFHFTTVTHPSLHFTSLHFTLLVPKDVITKAKITPCKVTSGEESQRVTAECCVTVSGLCVPPSSVFSKKADGLCLTFHQILLQAICQTIQCNWYWTTLSQNACSRYSDSLRAGRPRDLSSSPGRVKNFLFSTSSRPALRFTQPPIQWVPGALGVKRPGREADHSPSTIAEVKKMWIYTSTSPYAFLA